MELVHGHIYRAKKPARVEYFGEAPLFNDRIIVWMKGDGSRIQYDSPSVRDGRHLPTIDRDKFEKWAGTDVTEGYPQGEWAEWTSRA